MSDLLIKNVLSVPIEKAGSHPLVTHEPLSDFKKALGQSIQDLNQQLEGANQSVQEMAMGKKDIHQTMIAMEMAGISLRMMIQIRNKIIAAYEEIMRMQF